MAETYPMLMKQPDYIVEQEELLQMIRELIRSEKTLKYKYDI